ncbi:MAG: 3-alpha-hydroxysteroid dehydrogenase [Acidimicrobiales bacterium]|nr:3-alpha-hydroxysteroid dehydrogenase [Acidimicrobiales bacterium]
MTDQLWRYDGKHVVVTGVASGIGEAAAQELASLGARVTGLDMKEPTVDVDKFISFNMSDKDSIEHAVTQIEGPVDALFNIAGISNGAGPWLPVFTVNFIGFRHFTERVVPLMSAGGAIASVSSLAAIDYYDNLDAVEQVLDIDDWDELISWCHDHPDQFAGGGYGLAKQAVIGYSMRKCIEWAPGIRLNCIGPAPTETPLLLDTVKGSGKDWLDAFPRPAGRNATALEQASVLIFLNSPAASYVSGQMIYTDGGYTAGVTAKLVECVVGRHASRPAPGLPVAAK